MRAGIITVALLGLVLNVAAGSPVATIYHADFRKTPKLVLGYQPAPGRGGTPADQAAAYLRAHAGLFEIPADLGSLRLVRSRESLLGRHLHYQQFINGIPVENAEIIVSMAADGGIYQVFNNTYPQREVVTRPGRCLSHEEAMDRAWTHLRVHGELMARPAAELMYAAEGRGFRLIYRTVTSVREPRGSWEHRMDAVTGEILGVRDLRIREAKHPGANAGVKSLPDFTPYTGPVIPRKAAMETWAAAEALSEAATANVITATANGTALVFDPDPRTTLASDALVNTSPPATFNPAYVTRPLRDITLNGGTYSLKGPWVTITDFEAGELNKNPPSTTTTGNWTAKRGTNAFNDVMVYFHIDQNQRYIQSLGYAGTLGIQQVSISADSDGDHGADNAYYDPARNRLAFGHGGVPDPEDADVILHEYGHAITYGIDPSWGGGDMGAIGEGFGDYWGASYAFTTSNGPTYHPEWVFHWDGHNSYWAGRFMDRLSVRYDPAVTYDAHQDIGGGIQSDELWSTPLFQSFLALTAEGRPRAEIDTLILESFFGIGSGVTMREMASAIVATAQQLYPSGPHAQVFRDKFVAQNILLPEALPTPRLLYPGADDILSTGMTIRVQWDRGTAPSQTVGIVEYAQGTNVVIPFSDNMESGTGAWQVSRSTGTPVDWWRVTNSYHSASTSWFATNLASVSDLYLVSPPVTLGGDAVLSFWHSYKLEAGFDGGVVEISAAGTGGPWTDMGTVLTQNAYNATISMGYSSSIAGRKAFSGNSGGFIETRANLQDYDGRTVWFRFREANDNGTAVTGWWVDDVTVQYRWRFVGAAPTGVTVQAWTTPSDPATNYLVRVKLRGAGYADSAWAVSPLLTVSGDSDADGIPDAWEQKYFRSLTTAAATSDNDGDGSPDWAEYLAGTSPTNNGSNLRIVSFSDDPAGGCVVQWAGVSNRFYGVDGSTNLAAGFSAIASGLPATPPVNRYVDPSGTTDVMRAYRIRVE